MQDHPDAFGTHGPLQQGPFFSGFFQVLTLFSTLFRLFETRGREAPGTLVETFSDFGPKGPNRPCKWSTISQGYLKKLAFKRCIVLSAPRIAIANRSDFLSQEPLNGPFLKR